MRRGPYSQLTPLQLEPDRRNDEQVNGGNVWRMVAQEGPPSLRWGEPPRSHVFGDGRLSNGDAELEQFSMDPRGAPEGVFSAHLSNEGTDIGRDRWPAGLPRRFPASEQAKAGPV